MSSYRDNNYRKQESPEENTPRIGISEVEFEAFVTGTLALWVSSLFLLVLKSTHDLILDTSDVSTTASATATLASLALAFLGIVHQLNLSNKLLKLGFSFLTFTLLLSTFLVVTAYVNYGEPISYKPSVTLWIVSLALITVLPMIIRRLVLLMWGKGDAETISVVGGAKWLRDLFYALPFMIPVPLFASIHGNGKLLAYSVLLLMLGLVGIMVLTMVFVVQAYTKPSDQVGNLKLRLIELLKQERRQQYATLDLGSKADGDDFLMSLADLLAKPELFHESRTLLDRSLWELTDTNYVYKDPVNSSYYLAPSQNEIASVLEYVRSHYVVVYRQSGEESAPFFRDLRFVKELARKYKYPPVVMESYIDNRLKKLLEEEFRIGYAPSNWMIYVRKDETARDSILALWSTWMALNELHAADHGIDIPSNDESPSTQEDDGWMTTFTSTTRDIRVMRLVKPIAPVAVADIITHVEAGKILTTKILPRNFSSTLNEPDGLYSFFEALERRVRELRTKEDEV